MTHMCMAYMYFHLYGIMNSQCIYHTHVALIIMKSNPCTHVHTTIMCTHICVYTCMSNQWTTSLWIKRQARCYIQSHPLGVLANSWPALEWSGNEDCYIITHEMHSWTINEPHLPYIMHIVSCTGDWKVGDCYPITKCSHALTCLTAFCVWDSSPYFQQVWYWSKHIMLSGWHLPAFFVVVFQQAMVHCSGIVYPCVHISCTYVWEDPCSLVHMHACTVHVFSSGFTSL